MIRILRHVVAIAVLPFTVAAGIPFWLARRDAIRLMLGSTPGEIAVQACGWSSGDHIGMCAIR